MAVVASKITWLFRLLKEFGVTNLKPVTLECDNKSALQMAQNPVLNHCTKLIANDCHFTRENVLEGLIELRYVPTTEQLVDALTKIVASHQLKYLLSKLGMTYLTTSLRGCDKDMNYSPAIS